MKPINDYDEARREYYGPTVEDTWADQERISRLTDALEAVLSALDDIGLDNSRAYEIAAKALEGK